MFRKDIVLPTDFFYTYTGCLYEPMTDVYVREGDITWKRNHLLHWNSCRRSQKNIQRHFTSMTKKESGKMPDGSKKPFPGIRAIRNISL